MSWKLKNVKMLTESLNHFKSLKIPFFVDFNQQIGPAFVLTWYECSNGACAAFSVSLCVFYDLHFLCKNHGWFLVTAIEVRRDFVSHTHTHTHRKTTVLWSNRQTEALSLRKSDTLSVGSSCPQSQSIGGLFPSCWTYLDPLCPLWQAWLKGQCIGWIPRLCSSSNNQISLNKLLWIS